MIQTRSLATPPVKAPAPTPIGLQAAVGVILISALGLGFALRVNPELFVGGCSSRYGSERNASTSLKTLISAQADFRANDRDGNRVNDFWRGDVAGLYTLESAADGTALKLIELSVATADDRPVTDLGPYGVSSPKADYRFRAILHEDERTPSPDRFASCSFPDGPRSGKWTFIVDENNTIYRKELQKQRGVFLYPKDPEKAGWQKLD